MTPKPLEERIAELERQMALAGKYDVKTIVMAVGLVLAPAGVMWATVQRPQLQRIESLEHGQKDLQGDLTKDQVQTAELAMEFAQVGVAIQRVTEQRNAMHEQLEGRVAELWVHDFKVPMSRTEKYPEGKAVE